MDISVVLPVLNESDNLRILLPRIQTSLEREKLSYEIVVIDGGSIDGTRETAEALGARVVAERRHGFAGAMETGFAEAAGDYILTLDADNSDDPDFISKMWVARKRADIVIGSRYTRGGVTYSSFIRRWASFLLNILLSRMLSIPVRDVSSGFRLYRRAALEGMEITSKNFEVQEEVLVRAYARGFSVVEVPFVYFPRATGRSHVRLIRFGGDILRSAFPMWKLRNSLALRGLRRARLLQHHPDSAFLASAPPSLRRRTGRAAPSASSTRAVVRASSYRASTTPSGWTSISASCAFCAATGCRWSRVPPSRCRLAIRPSTV